MTLETCEVELFGLQMEHVPVAARLEPAVPEGRAQPRHVDVDAVGGTCRHAFTPEGVDQAVRRDDVAGVQEQERQERRLLAGAHMERSPVRGHLERAEKTEVECVCRSQPGSFSARVKNFTRPNRAKSSADQARRPTLGHVVLVREACVGITERLRWFVALVLALSLATASSQASTPPPPNPTDERPSTVVVRVNDGFHWADAGLGAAAALATTLLALGVVLALRPDRGGDHT
jgi:hypothetical protein